MEKKRTYGFFQKNSKFIIFLALFLIFLIVSGFTVIQGKWDLPFVRIAPAAPPNSIGSGNGIENGVPAWLTIYFTNPDPPDTIGKGIDLYVQMAMDNAKTSIDVASFDLNLPNVINALVKASIRGVKVRVVYDGTNGSLDYFGTSNDNKAFDTIQTLKSANILLADGGRSNGLMHNKMVIVDGKILFTGSWNLSYNDTYRNNNNLLQITDPKIIINYETKFNEMFIDKRFGNRAQVKIPYPSLNIDGTLVENYMAPEDNPMAKLVKLVQGARKTIHFMAYTFTSEDLENAMIARSKAGVRVEGIIENRNAYQGSLMDLYNARVEVRTDGNKYNMHHKVIIIDGETVITGSFNFTKAANTINDENILIFHHPEIAALFEQEYQRIFNQSEKPLK